MEQLPFGFTMHLDEQLCNNLVNSIRGIVWEADPSDFRFSYVSPQAEQILGYPSRQWLEETDFWYSHTHPDDVRWCSEYRRRASARGENHQFEYRMIAADGRTVWLHDIVTVVKTDNGPARLRGIMVDITDRRQAEQGLRDQKELSRAMIDQTPDGVVLEDGAALEVSEVNDIACESLDYSRQEIAHLNSIDINAEFAEDLHGNRLEATVQALRESEERYRKLVELSPDSIFIHRDGRFVFMNATGAKLLGAGQPEELYGMDVLDFVHPDYREKVRQRIANAWGRRKNPAIEMVLARTDQTTVPVEMVSVYYNYQKAHSVLAVARDISERKRLQDELVKAQRLESLGLLAGGIAHDFNNILTGIMGNISLLRHQIEPLSPMADRLESCEKAAIRASELTQQLLTFARGGAPVKKLMEPSALIRESATFVLHGSHIGCEIELAEDLWNIEADAGQISQVLHNVLFNAMQAMPDGGVITISAKNRSIGPRNSFSLPAGDYLHINIKDRGCGIAPEIIPKIFDPYFSTKSEGNGLGLASVYSVIKRHGGTVDVNSTVGIGTLFAILLPAVTGPRFTEVEGTVENKLTGNGRILIMDDEQIIRDVAMEILKTAGYDVETCPDGKEAIARYQRWTGTGTTFDAVIMDLTVPGGIGGKEAAGHILDIDPNAVLIVSSGYSNDPVIADFRRYGFKGVVAKPFSASTLVTEVHRLTTGIGDEGDALLNKGLQP